MKTNLRNSLIPICVTLVAFIITLLVLKFNWIQQGTFLILSLTLIGVIWYAYFNFLQVRKKNNPVLSVEIKYISETNDVRVLVRNLCDQYLETEIILTFNINGTITNIGPEYTGEIKWNLTPYIVIDGHFPLNRPIKNAGFTYDELKELADQVNPTKLYQFSQQAKWKNEDGIKGEYPPHYWYYDFLKDKIVYQVGGFK